MLNEAYAAYERCKAGIWVVFRQCIDKKATYMLQTLRQALCHKDSTVLQRLAKEEGHVVSMLIQYYTL